MSDYPFLSWIFQISLEHQMCIVIKLISIHFRILCKQQFSAATVDAIFC